MEKSLIYYPKLALLMAVCCLVSCQSKEVFYKKTFTEAEKLEQAEMLNSGMGYRYYYQGDIGEQFIVNEAVMYNPNQAEVWRERGIPYLKRGMAGDFYAPYQRCVELDAVTWQGYRGYCYLYFYRDYERALADFNALDTLTPNFIDHPQAQSVDFMRGICYLGMGDNQQALAFLDKHIAEETKQVGVDYIAAITFVLKGIAHQKEGQMELAQATFEQGSRIHEQNVDLEYYLAQLLLEKGEFATARKLVQKAKKSFDAGYFTTRSYVEEFHQVYWADLLDLEAKIPPTRRM